MLLGVITCHEISKQTISRNMIIPLAVAQGLKLRTLMRSHSGTQALCFNSLSSPDCCGCTTYSLDFAMLVFTG